MELFVRLGSTISHDNLSCLSVLPSLLHSQPTESLLVGIVKCHWYLGILLSCWFAI